MGEVEDGAMKENDRVCGAGVKADPADSKEPKWMDGSSSGG